MSDILVAIHQPNFFPWLGYFDKIRRADVFVLLDDVQFPKTGGSYSNRVKIIRNGKSEWLTAPIDRQYSGLRTIQEMRFASSEWRVKLRDRLCQAYAAAPYFDAVIAFVGPLIANPSDCIADYNVDAVLAMARRFGLNEHAIVRSSDLPVTSSGTSRLIDLTIAVGGTSYLSGGGAGGYQEPKEFERRGIELIFQDFVHPVYARADGAAFTPGLSVIDGLMNCGPDAVSEWVRSGGPTL